MKPLLPTVEFTESACDTYTWALNGQTYTASGDYNYVVGCVTNILHLTITPSSIVEFNEAACDTYTWALNGTTYTVSGDYTYVVGCVTNILHLTITPSGNNEYTESACDSYFWAVSGLTYTVSGDYTFVNGCSTNILHLTITPSSTVEFTASACDTYTWALNGMTYTASGDYNYVVGCVTNVLHLTITPSSTVEVTASACDTYTWALNGMTYTASGDYNYVVGCVTNVLHLTITNSVAPAVSIVESANNVVAGTSVTFTATPVNGGTAAYAWFVNGLPAGTNNFQLTYAPANGDAVYVVMTSSLTCVTVPTATSNTINMVVTPVIPMGAVWTGLANNGDWFTAGNWDTGVPGAITNVTIPGGLGANYPMNAGVCNNLLVANGASLMVNPTVGGTATVQSFVTAGQYHFISSPVASATAGSAFPLSTYMRKYDELQPTQQWVNILAADVLVPFTGISTFIPVATGDHTANYVGSLNDGAFSNAGLTFTANSTASYDGYNLLGNPYASRIDLEAGVSLSNVDNAIYFWNPAINNYSYWVIGGAGVNGASANVPVGQGFFVKVSTPGFGTFGVSNAVRTNAVQAFYKNSINNVIRLKVEGDIYSDETMVRFNDQASSQFDSQFDAYKLKASDVNHLYTKTADGSDLAINALTSIEENTSIPVYFEVAHNGTYSLTASELETIAGSVPVWLEDLKTGAVQNLRENAVYAFSANVNDNVNRFKLTFAVLGVDDKPLQNVNIWSVDKNIHMQLPVVVKGNVRVTNAAGQTLLNSEINAVGEYVIHAPVAAGIYMVTITSNEGTVTKKVFIK
ncbi:MAG: T9SS type A sorting domain-containing protein [Bacteroidales bacterium]|nr:T9SS type A sorting domain-containing protein [Bacteroidales bacterium]